MAETGAKRPSTARQGPPQMVYNDRSAFKYPMPGYTGYRPKVRKELPRVPYPRLICCVAKCVSSTARQPRLNRFCVAFAAAERPQHGVDIVERVR